MIILISKIYVYYFNKALYCKRSFLVGSQHRWSCICVLTNVKLIISGLMRMQKKLMMILYDFGWVRHLLLIDHLQYHTWSEVVGVRQKGRVYGLSLQAYAYESNTSTSASFNNSGVDDIITQRVAALTKEIKEMKQIQANIQT